MSIVSRWQSLSKNEKKEDEVQMSLTKLKAEDVKTQDHGKALCICMFYLLGIIVLIFLKLLLCIAGDQNQKLILFKALLLQVICLYQKVVPHLVIESKFDFSKLLKGNIFQMFSSWFENKSKKRVSHIAFWNCVFTSYENKIDHFYFLNTFFCSSQCKSTKWLDSASS